MYSLQSPPHILVSGDRTSIVTEGATGVNSVAIGPNAKTAQISLMAPINDDPANINNLHDVATSTPTASVAIGNNAVAAAGSSIAIGDGAKTLLGWNYDLTKPAPHPSVANVYGIAIGTGATAIGNNMVIGGQGAENRLFAGQDTTPNNINNITLGNGAGANMKGNENIILGYQAGVGMTGALGAGANIVIGKNAGLNASGDNSRIAIGENAGQNVTRSGNIGIGSQAGSGVGKMAGSQYASLIPTGGWQGWGWLYCMEGATTCPKVLPAPWNPNIILDNGGSLDGVSNVGVGNLAGFDTHGSVNVGIGFKGGLGARGFGNVGIGANAGASVLGSHNVAMGTDAGTYYVNGNANTAIGAGSGMNIVGGYNSALGSGAQQGVTGDNNTAVGKNSGQTVAGYNNFAGSANAGRYVSGDDNVALGSGAGQGTSTASLAINRTVAVGQGARAYSNDSIAMGATAVAGTTSGNVNAIAIGKGAKAIGNQSISIGTGNEVYGNNSGAIGDPTFINADSSYSVGNNNDIAAGQTDVFALGNSITKTASNSVFLGSTSEFVPGDYAAGTTVPSTGATGSTAGMGIYPSFDYGAGFTKMFAGSAPVGVVSVGAVGAERRIQNVAAGLISATSTDAINGSQLYWLWDYVNQGWNLNVGAGTGTGGTGSTGGAGTVTGDTNPVPVRPGDSVNIVSGTNINVDKGTTTNDNGTTTTNVTISTQPNLVADSLTINNGGPVINSSGINMNNHTITNLAPGVAGTDAVNVDQLTKTKTDLTAAGMNFAGNAGAPVHRDLGQTLTIQGGATTAGTYSGNNIKTVTDPATGTVNLQMADSPQFGTVTVNDGGSGRITGVAPGVAGTDAVNVDQLKAANVNINNQLNDLDKEARAGTASAMATAGLPQAYLPGKSMVAVGGATYRGATGVALGVSTITDNGKWIFKGSVNSNNKGHVGATLAAGYQW